jgi:hypothetical protein
MLIRQRMDGICMHDRYAGLLYKHEINHPRMMIPVTTEYPCRALRFPRVLLPKPFFGHNIPHLVYRTPPDIIRGPFFLVFNSSATFSKACHYNKGAVCMTLTMRLSYIVVVGSNLFVFMLCYCSSYIVRFYGGMEMYTLLIYFIETVNQILTEPCRHP